MTRDSPHGKRGNAFPWLLRPIPTSPRPQDRNAEKLPDKASSQRRRRNAFPPPFPVRPCPAAVRKKARRVGARGNPPGRTTDARTTERPKLPPPPKRTRRFPIRRRFRRVSAAATGKRRHVLTDPERKSVPRLFRKRPRRVNELPVPTRTLPAKRSVPTKDAVPRDSRANPQTRFHNVLLPLIITLLRAP